MKIVTGFEEQFEKVEAPAVLDSSQYVQIFQALEHNHEVAENAFARIAKTHFRTLVDGGVRRKGAADAKGLWPTYFSETTCTIDISEFSRFEDGIKRGAERLVSLVEKFSQYLLSEVTGGGEKKCLVESLNTRIIRTGETLYSFRIKQRWGIDG